MIVNASDHASSVVTSPVAVFPIMIDACAFLKLFASKRFLLSGRHQIRAGLGLTLGGLPAVLIAAVIG